MSYQEPNEQLPFFSTWQNACFVVQPGTVASLGPRPSSAVWRCWQYRYVSLLANHAVRFPVRVRETIENFNSSLLSLRENVCETNENFKSSVLVPEIVFWVWRRFGVLLVCVPGSWNIIKKFSKARILWLTVGARIYFSIWNFTYRRMQTLSIVHCTIIARCRLCLSTSSDVSSRLLWLLYE